MIRHRRHPPMAAILMAVACCSANGSLAATRNSPGPSRGVPQRSNLQLSTTTATTPALFGVTKKARKLALLKAKISDERSSSSSSSLLSKEVESLLTRYRGGASSSYGDGDGYQPYGQDYNNYQQNSDRNKRRNRQAQDNDDYYPGDYQQQNNRDAYFDDFKREDGYDYYGRDDRRGEEEEDDDDQSQERYGGFDDRGIRPGRQSSSSRNGRRNGGGGGAASAVMDFMPAVIKTGDRRIGLTLLAGGSIITMLGISLFFNKTLMRLGNLLFIAGVPITIGPSRTMGYFFKPEKMRATACLALGIFLVLMGNPVFGILLEGFGLLNLFGNMFPVFWAIAKNMPVIGPILSGKGNNNNNNNSSRNRRDRPQYYDDYDRPYDDRQDYYENDGGWQGDDDNRNDPYY